jgi:hypothetical protein
LQQKHIFNKLQLHTNKKNIMKMNYPLIICIALLLSVSCKSPRNGDREGQPRAGQEVQKDNDLLNSEMKVRVFISTKEAEMGKFDRFGGLYIEDLAGMLVSKATAGEIEGHNPYNMDPAVDELMSMENINNNIGGTFVPGQYKGIMFYEQWYANARDQVFTKRPLSYAVARYIEYGGTEIKSLIFRYNTDRDGSGMAFEPMVRGIRQQMSLYHGFYTDYAYDLPCQVKDSLLRAYQRLNPAFQGYRFYLKLVELIEAGQATALDPYDHSRELSIGEFQKRLGKRTEVMMIPDTSGDGQEMIEKKIELPPAYNMVTDIVFEEDWDICPETLYIRKRVNYVTFLQKQGNQERTETVLVPVFSVKMKKGREPL